MRKSNSEILNKVKNVVNEKKKTNPSNKNFSINKTNETNEFLAQWIEVNAEKITKEIIKEEVKKIFK